MSALTVSRRRKPISLTALIDVVFILLMFFMLTSSFSQWKTVSLDAAANALSTPARPPELLVVDAAGQIRRLPERRLEPLADLIQSLPADAAVVLLPEADTPVQQIVNGLSALQAQGISGVTLGQPLPAPQPR